MPLHRFLNFVYRAMTQRLDYSNEEEAKEVRRKLDGELLVSSWRTPGHVRDFTPATRTVDIDGEEFVAPPWWRGEEEASQSFLAAMGVTLDE